MKIRSVADLERTVRALAFHFDTDRVFVMGSQAILVGWPDAPVAARVSQEFDAYPGNWQAWESRHGVPASEEIFAFFGEGSQFHETFGFYIDGIDESTCVLPPDWRTRAVTAEVQDDARTVTAVAPSTLDLIVSKAMRLSDKDRSWIEAIIGATTLDREMLLRLTRSVAAPPAVVDRAVLWLEHALP